MVHGLVMMVSLVLWFLHVLQIVICVFCLSCLRLWSAEGGRFFADANKK